MSVSTLLVLLLFSYNSEVIAYEYCGAYCIMASVFGLFGVLFCMCGLFCFICILAMLVYYLVDLSRKKKETAPTVHFQSQSFPLVSSNYKVQLPQIPLVQMQPPTQTQPAPAPRVAQSQPPSYSTETGILTSHLLNSFTQSGEEPTPLIVP